MFDGVTVFIPPAALVRRMWESLSRILKMGEMASRRDAGAEPTWTYLRRVTEANILLLPDLISIDV